MAPPGLLYNAYRLSYLGVMRPERDAVPSPGAEVKDIVKLYLYSPSVLSWHAIQCCCAFMARYIVFFPPFFYSYRIYIYVSSILQAIYLLIYSLVWSRKANTKLQLQQIATRLTKRHVAKSPPLPYAPFPPCRNSRDCLHYLPQPYTGVPISP